MAKKKVEVFLEEEQLEKLSKIDRVRSYAIRFCVEKYLEELEKEENKK